MNELSNCPICGCEIINVGECKINNEIKGYNVYCDMCKFTARTYRQKWKAIKKWNALYRMSKEW